MNPNAREFISEFLSRDERQQTLANDPGLVAHYQARYPEITSMLQDVDASQEESEDEEQELNTDSLPQDNVEADASESNASADSGKLAAIPLQLAANRRKEAEEGASFPFFRLPAELRLVIYRFALMRPRPLLLHIEKPTILPVGAKIPTELSTNRRATTSGVINNGSNLYAPYTLSTRSRAPVRVNKNDVFYPEANSDPIIVALLRVSKEVYHEARPVLYKENTFLLHLPSANYTLSTLHQRSRTLIPSIRITIPTHHDILEEFANLVRLGLRYCWGLKMFTIKLPPIPDERPYGANPASSSNVYAGAFHILRWLPKNAEVVLEGGVPAEVKRVVEENRSMAKVLDERAYARRQHQQTGGS